jgi:hypothetical protein
MLGLVVLLKLLRSENLEVLALVEGILDRDGAVTMERVLPALEDRWSLRVEEGFATCWLFCLLTPDSPPLRRADSWPAPPEAGLLKPGVAGPPFLGDFSAKMGSANSIRATVSVTKAILAFPQYFSINIIQLLSSATLSCAYFHSSRHILSSCSIY